MKIKNYPSKIWYIKAAQWNLYIPHTLTVTNCAFSPQNAFIGLQDSQNKQQLFP
jgi:hypothetical protein